VIEVDGVPIVDSLWAWVRAAEVAVDHRRAGTDSPGEGYFGAIPDSIRRDEILDFYGLSPA
jgi:allantoin racemase